MFRLGLVFVVLLVACKQQESASPRRAPAERVLPRTDPRVKKAQAAVRTLKATLKGALFDALSKGGPEAAIEVCSSKAQELARAAGTADVTVGRTAPRLRNPGNAPRPWVEPLLAAYERGDKAAYRTARLEGGGVGYVEPIFTARICLGCHGSNLAPDLASRIKKHYPGDRATGFDAGDLRGLFWAEAR